MTKKAWKVLSQLAETRVGEARRMLQQVDQALALTQGRKNQILALMAENQARLMRQTGGQTMADIQVITIFLSNLGLALRGTDEELHKLIRHREQLVEKFNTARKEEQKMESLIERDATRQEKAASIREQKAMDAAAISAFNRR